MTPRLAVAEAGAIPPLVAMLAEDGRARLNAAGALGSLAEGSMTFQSAIAGEWHHASCVDARRRLRQP